MPSDDSIFSCPLSLRHVYCTGKTSRSDLQLNLCKTFWNYSRVRGKFARSQQKSTDLQGKGPEIFAHPCSLGRGHCCQVSLYDSHSCDGFALIGGQFCNGGRSRAEGKQVSVATDVEHFQDYAKNWTLLIRLALTTPLYGIRLICRRLRLCRFNIAYKTPHHHRPGRFTATLPPRATKTCTLSVNCIFSRCDLASIRRSCTSLHFIFVNNSGEFFYPSLVPCSPIGRGGGYESLFLLIFLVIRYHSLVIFAMNSMFSKLSAKF